LRLDPGRVLVAFLLAAAAMAAGAELPTRKSSAASVSIAVTPKSIAPDAKVWEFAVVFDTHSKDLRDDLMKSAVLVAGTRESLPLEWQGAPPGGHHRAGVLKFNAIRPLPEAIELRIVRPGEAAPRSFRWRLR